MSSIFISFSGLDDIGSKSSLLFLAWSMPAAYSIISSPPPSGLTLCVQTARLPRHRSLCVFIHRHTVSFSFTQTPTLCYCHGVLLVWTPFYIPDLKATGSTGSGAAGATTTATSTQSSALGSIGVPPAFYALGFGIMAGSFPFQVARLLFRLLSFFLQVQSIVFAVLDVSCFANFFSISPLLSRWSTQVVSIKASPLLEKRISQVIVDPTIKWEAACVRYFSSFSLS